MNLGYLLLLFLSLLIQSCLSVPQSRFYDYGGSTGDQTFTNADDQSTSLNLQSNFVFYGTNYSAVFINNNGLLSFNEAISGYTSEPFPLPEILIAPFWADVDTNGDAGVVYYRETTASAIVNKVAQDVALAFRSQPPFTAKSVVIVTWDQVGYYDENDDKLNTFQCVLATDGGRSYVLFLYLDDGINWVTGDVSGGMDGLGGTEAYVGFNSGGSNPTFFAVEGSRTPAVIDIETTSNVEVAGLWIFQVNEAEIITSTVGSCVTPDQLYANAAILSYNTTTVNSTATYSCQNGYNLVGDSVRTCQSSGNWSGSPPYCQIVNCTDLMVESSGALSVSYSSNSYSYNSTAIFSCQNGYNLVGDSVRTCQSSGNWSGSPPYCQIVNCTDLMVESSGALSVSYSSNSYSYNSTAIFSCQNGYSLVGTVTRTCQSSGSWSGNTPYCQIVNCTDLMVESSGALSVSYSSNSYSYNSTAIFSCQNGYNLVGTATRTCQSSGSWSGNAPYCQIVNCTDLMVESSGALSVSYSSSSYSYNSTATFSCQNGYNLVGDSVRTCQSSGNWSGSPPYCQIVNCTDLMVESSGALSVSYSSNSYSYNSTAIFSCQNGYSLVGTVTRTCQSSGSWSGNTPYCQIVNCTDLMVESSGALSVSYSSNSYSYNSTAIFSCQNGYNLVGTATRTCQSSGSWSGNAPYCQIVNCTDLMVESSGALSVSYSSSSYSYNSTATFSCQNGYNLVGDSVRTCQSSGNWSGSPPYCQIVNCTDLMVESSGALSVSYSSNSYSYNSTAIFSCQNGYSLVGTVTRTCQSSGSWSGNTPYCQIVNCTDLMVESSGALSVSYSSNSYSYNSTATFSCQNGYNLIGTSTRTCLSDGSWDGNEPYCQIVNCTELMVESNAVGGLSISYSSNSRSYNSTVTYSCQNGYTLAGVSVRTCLSDGNWSGDPPYCQSINCSELYVESSTYGGLSVISSSSSLNGTATYSCTYEGYMLVGNGVRTCQANGNWSGVEPNCEITAINPYGTSNESSIIISWDVPCQPRDITADRMINNYTVMVTDTATGEYFTITTTMIPVVLSNLTLNTNYSIRIAVFTNQLGPFSDPIYISTQLKAPTSPPFDLTINSSSPSSFMISWTPPMLDYLNGPNVTYVIQVESANSSSNYTSETNYAHIVGLQPFTTYWSRVAVRNNAGMGPYSISIEIKTPGDAPSIAPADIIFNFTDPRTLFIQWGLIPFSNRNGMIFYYEVLVTTEEKTYTYKTCDRNITIDSLQPSNTYNVSVAAFTNDRGPFSDPISITMPNDIPSGRPQSPSVAATATSLNISWSAPNEEDRNGDINGYVINVTNTDTLVTMQFTTANNEFSVNDLDPDTTYSLSVAARNANGTGPFTRPILIRTDQSAPSRPRRLKATAISPSSILLAWEPPASPNGDITAYHISITDEETGNVVIQETSNLTYVIITDLTPNNTYRCHVAAATTSMGPDSEYVFFNTEEDTPSASPSSVMSTVINSTAITVSWSPLNQSATNGVIRHYKVSITNAVTESEEVLTTTTPNLTITMLTPFTQYSVRVAAFTIGSGPYSNPIYVMTAEDVPSDAPESFNVTNNGPTSLILKWSPPKNLNGMIRSYKITIRDETNGTVICFNTTELEVTVNNLNPFTTYTCNVTAYTVAPGPAASVTIRTPESVPGGPPTGVMIKSVSYTSINISWTTPEMSNGVIRSYVIRISNGSVVKEYNATGMDTFIVIRGLGSNQNYTISLAAVTNERGPFSDNLPITLEEKVATDPPTGLMNELNGTNLTLNWQPPPDGSVDGAISGYRINCTGENGHVISKTVSMTSSSVQLESGNYYKCTVCTLTSAGCGPAAVNYINTYSGSSVGAPHSVIVNATDLTILIKWEPPLDPLNVITSYIVTYQLLDTPLSLTVPRPIATVSGITDTMYLLDSVIAGSSYDITVYANTSRGAGLQSDPITVTTKEPDSLLNFTCITDSATDIDCSWEDLPDDDVYHLHYSILPSFSYYGDSEGTIDIDLLNEGHFHDLQPYAGYILSIQTTANVSIASTVAFTDPEIPSVSVNDVSFDKDSLILSWDLPPKAEWRGIIENFIIKAVPLQSIGEGPISKRSTGNNTAPQEIEITVAPSMNNPDPSLAMEPFQRESVNISNLEQDYAYSLTVAIDNEAGNGPFSAPMNITVPEAAPSGPPINLMLANVNQTSFTVTWEPPNLLERNGRIVGYTVQVTRVNLLETRSFETNDTYISLQGYYPYERIMVKVAAETSVGLGPYSSVLDFNTSQNVPSAPLSFNGDIIGRDGIELRWEMPRTTPGVISEYQVTYSGYTIASNIQVVGPIQTSLSEKRLRLNSLRTGLVYHFSVRAKTAAGFGPNATTVVVLEDISSTISSVSGGVQEEGTIAASVLAGLFGLILCLFLCLLLLCCLCMMRRRRRRKRDDDSNEYQTTNNKMYINPDNEMKEVSFADVKRSPRNGDEKKPSGDSKNIYDVPNSSGKRATTVSVNTSRPADYEYDTVTSPEETSIQFEGNDGSSMMEVKLYFTDESSDEEEIKKN